MALSNHGIIAAIEVAVYILLLAPAIHNVVHFGVRQHTGWLFMCIFSMFKITGASLLIYTNENPSKASIGLQVATQIFYQIALGPLLSATLSFFNGSTPTKASKSSSRGVRGLLTNLPHFLRLIHLVVIVAVALGVMGGINRAPTSNGQINKSKYDSGATYSKISSCLLLVALIGITYGLIRYWSARSLMSEPQRTLLPAIGFAIPLLFMRVVYSLLASFTLDTSGNMNRTKIFNMFSGNIAAYIVLAMLPQIGVVVLYSVTGFIAKKKHQHTKIADGSNGKIPA
ncbi:uncharacterized protein BDZ99DRAFT_478526 [Mytilinidion resinicola]|uniref:DUF7702 domain-containing protein n=1 Tax=Mytilinidion resinicola TaxID=574789 RepID=A0A6A6YJ61_9PEZI|nr:uncharacterized protein BDZ99DRAFT_478526 [Mytilinidion resinicola]KAF2808024.1 hypothetical protein BDZ99DRAFT_478526 [Mytilinidion resinicola]